MAVEEIQIHSSRRKPLHFDGNAFSSSNDFDMTEGDLQKAREELKECDENRIDCLKQLREMLEGDTVMLYRKDDKYLLRYLRYSKFNCKRAYSMMQNFYSFRINHPELFELPSNLEYMLNTNLFSYLPYRDVDGSVVYLIDYDKWNLDEMSFEDFLLVFNAIADIISMSPHCQIHGLKIIVDFRGISARHLWQLMNPMHLILETKVFQSLHPYRIKRIIGIYCNSVIRMCYRSMKYLFKKKVADRVLTLGSDMAELHQYVSPAVLPKEYGGTLDDKECGITEIVMENLPYLKYERTFGAVPK